MFGLSFEKYIYLDNALEVMGENQVRVCVMCEYD